MRALLVVDLQRWFLEVGALEKQNFVSLLIEKINELIKHFEQRNLPIIEIQTTHKADKSTWNQWAIEHNVGRLIEGTREAEYAPNIYIAKQEVWITKTRFSVFIRTDLESKLRTMRCNDLLFADTLPTIV